jgi:metal-dependent amidase/aminoacylase/carboxypeptidase family protein
MITGGHNLICIGGMAAALGAVERLKADPKLPGQVVILGTPAEEGSGSDVRISSSS